MVEVAPGRKLVLCVECRKALRKLRSDREVESESGIRRKASGIRSAEDAGDLKPLTDDRAEARP